MTTTHDAAQVIVFSMVTTVGTTLVADLTKGHVPPMRVAIGGAVAGFALLGAAQFAPELAQKFALLILFTSLFTAGAVVFTRVAALTKG